MARCCCWSGAGLFTRPRRARRLLAVTFLLFHKLQARSHEAKVVALTSVVDGKDVESEAMLLRRQLEGERLVSPLLGAPLPSHDSSGKCRVRLRLKKLRISVI